MTTQNEMTDDLTVMSAEGCLLPEAGGVAFADLWRPDGIKISVTCRSTSGPEALDDIMATIDYGLEVHKLTQAPPQAMAQRAQPAAPKAAPVQSGPPEPPAPPEDRPLQPGPTVAKANGAKPAPVAKTATPTPESTAGTGEEIVTFRVERIEAQTTPNGKPTFKVFGGPFSKFGVTCWPEVMAEQFDLDSISVGDSWAPVELTVKALKQDGKVKKVIGFVA